MKLFIKKSFSLILKFGLPLILPLFSQRVNITLEWSIKILNDFSPDSHGNVDANNEIIPKYDLHIIIPCYNVEKYVVDCLKSVFSQETNFSCFVTIVNDGSTDNTLELIQQYILKLSYEKQMKVQIINQENKGLAAARNTGLSHIVGKYVMFIDSDDMLLPNAIQKTLDVAFEKKLDIVVGGYINIDENNNFISSISSRYHGFAWGKIYKSEIFRNLKFPEYLFEDTIVSCCIYPQWKNKSLIKDIIYQYRKNSKSIMSTHKVNKKSIDVFYLYPQMFKYLLDKNIFIPEIIFRHVALAYQRTCNIDSKIKYAGFSILCNCVEEIIKKYPQNILDRMNYKEKKMLNALLNKDFAKYALISKHWFYL